MTEETRTVMGDVPEDAGVYDAEENLHQALEHLHRVRYTEDKTQLELAHAEVQEAAITLARKVEETPAGGPVEVDHE